MMFSVMAAVAAAQLQPPTTPIDRDRRPPVPKVEPQKPAGSATVQAQGSQEPIRTIAFQGVEAPAEVARAAEAFLGRPATRETLVELAAALSRAYERTDIALYTVAVPDQDFGDGVVVVDLAEGWIDSVRVDAPDGERFPLVEARAARLVGENPLSRGRFERQVSLIQSIPGLTVDASFDNPEGDDSVQFILVPKQKRREFALGINNRGPHLLADVILQAGADFYRLFADGDQLSLSGYASHDFDHYLAVDGTYAVPLTASGLTMSATAGWIGTRARHTDLRGHATFAGLAMSHPILRRARSAADISISIDGVNSKNALFGNVFATERSRAARLAAAYVSASEQDNLTASATLSQGLDIFGADVSDADGEAGFSKVNATLAYERTLVPRLLGRLNVLAQYSGDRVPAAELFAVGGATIGRAFDTGLLTGDRGIGGIVELAYRPLASGEFAQSEGYVFGDAATLTLEDRIGFPGQSFSLASAGAGIRVRYKDRIQLGVEAAAVVDRPFAGYDDDVRLSFYYSMLF
jgi:hemolysin activation/secretion protein